MKRMVVVTAIALAASVNIGHLQAQEPLKIGVMLPTSGVLAAIGREQVNAMQLAVEDAGSSVAGRKIELIVEDTAANPSTGLTKARKLVISDKVDVLAGIVSSAVALAVAPYAAGAKIPVVISNAGTDLLSGGKCDRYVLRASYSIGQSAKPIGEWMAKKGVKRVFILASDYVAPRESVEVFKNAFTAGGGQIVGEVYTPFGKTQDYGPYISQMRAANPEALFAVYYGGEAILFTKQYESFGIKDKIPLYSAIGLTPPNLRSAQGHSGADVIQSINYFAELGHPENQRFVEAYKKKFNEEPGEFAAYAYDTIRIILEGVKARKGDTSDKGAFVSAMEKVAFTGPRGPIKLSSTDRGVVQNFYIVKSIKRGDSTGFELIETLPNYPDPVTGCKLD
jgi:branched-chain amino acid transport system substrate-binding protein